MSNALQVRVNELEFNCLAAGNPDDPLVILLHGFPESAIMWKRLMVELSAQGYYCVAPDMRGYSPKAAPKGTRSYEINHLANDVLAIAATFGKPFHLIAHDWGAVIGWYLAYHHSENLISYSALSVPHHSAYGKALKIDKVQKKKSRYILWFLVPFLPEMYLRRNDFAFFKKLWKYADQEEVAYNLKIFRNKKSLTGALNYYRANFKALKKRKIGSIKIPTLFIWGNRDVAVGEIAARANGKYMPTAYRFLEVTGGHWLIQSNYKEVKHAVSQHLASYQS